VSLAYQSGFQKVMVMLKRDSTAGLRHEYKFLLHPGQYLQLRQILKKVMHLDRHVTSDEGYHVRSLYFDDVYDTAMQEKLLGHVRRKKFRIRIYNYSAGCIKLEIKEKYQDHIHKKSCVIFPEEYEKIIRGDVTFLNDSEDVIKKTYYMEFRNNLLKPKVIIDYLREAYVLPYNQIRVTFDKNLSAGKPCREIFNRDLYVKRLGQDYAVILEIKYNNYFPQHLRSILEMYCSNRLAVSKYLLGREFLNR